MSEASHFSAYLILLVSCNKYRGYLIIAASRRKRSSSLTGNHPTITSKNQYFRLVPMNRPITNSQMFALSYAVDCLVHLGKSNHYSSTCMTLASRASTLYFWALACLHLNLSYLPKAPALFYSSDTHPYSLGLRARAIHIALLSQCRLLFLTLFIAPPKPIMSL